MCVNMNILLSLCQRQRERDSLESSQKGRRKKKCLCERDRERNLLQIEIRNIDRMSTNKGRLVRFIKNFMSF